MKDDISDYDIARSTHHFQCSVHSVYDIKLMASVANNISHIRLLENQISLLSFYLEPSGNTLLKYFPLKTGDSVKVNVLLTHLCLAPWCMAYRNAVWDEVDWRALDLIPCVSQISHVTLSKSLMLLILSGKWREQDLPASQAVHKHVMLRYCGGGGCGDVQSRQVCYCSFSEAASAENSVSRLSTELH